MKDPYWNHHEGYPRDRGDDEATITYAAGDGRSPSLYMVTMESVAGPIDVGHHVHIWQGKVRGCISSSPRCIGTVGRIDRKIMTVTIRLNDYGKKSLQ